jgi:hypothetical protein
MRSKESDLDIILTHYEKVTKDCMRCEQQKQCTYKRTIDVCSRNYCCRGKAISVTYFEFVSVASAIQHAKRTRHITLPFVARPAVSYFSALSHKPHDFQENVPEGNMCVFVSSTTLSEMFLILRRIEQDIIINVHRSTCEVYLPLSDFNET